MVGCVLAAGAVGCGGDDGQEPRSAAEADRRATPPRTAPAPPADAGDRAVEHLEAIARLTERAGGDRVASSDGERALADYAADRLRAAGYRVRFTAARFPFFEERSPARLTIGGDRVGARREVRGLAYAPGGTATGRVRRIAYDRPDSGCRESDFAALRRGEVAVPGRGVCPFATKVRLAQRAGAAAVVVVDREEDEAVPATLGRPGVARIPAVVVGRGLAERLEDGARVRVRTDAVSETRTARSVIADAPPATRGGRVVMVGAHMDSVPEGPGMNDDASGVAATLAAAEALARTGARVRVGLWAAEELGLHGSRAYVRGLGARERRAITAYVNLDMVGSPEGDPEVYAGGPTSRAERVRRALLAGLRVAGVERPGRTALRGGSDHAPFVRAGIAAGGIFTGAGRPEDPCYHRACDDLDNVDRTDLRRSARATVTALRRLSP